jgi:hypothetical protein
MFTVKYDRIAYILLKRKHSSTNILSVLCSYTLIYIQERCSDRAHIKCKLIELWNAMTNIKNKLKSRYS